MFLSLFISPPFSPRSLKPDAALRPPGPSHLALGIAVPGRPYRLSPGPETFAGATGALGCFLGPAGVQGAVWAERAGRLPDQGLS